MEPIKLAAEISADLPQQPEAANDVRTLSELELVLCGGGEGQVNW
jgi:hypothetical protein